jgi:hypothetical protein
MDVQPAYVGWLELTQSGQSWESHHETDLERLAVLRDLNGGDRLDGGEVHAMVCAWNAKHRWDEGKHERNAGDRAEILLVAQERDDCPEHDERGEGNAPPAQLRV